MGERSEGADEVVILVSPICSESLKVAANLKKWAIAKGVRVREVSVLRPEGQRYLMDLRIDRIPAVILGERVLLKGGSFDPSLLERELGLIGS